MDASSDLLVAASAPRPHSSTCRAMVPIVPAAPLPRASTAILKRGFFAPEEAAPLPLKQKGELSRFRPGGKTVSRGPRQEFDHLLT